MLKPSAPAQVDQPRAENRQHGASERLKKRDGVILDQRNAENAHGTIQYIHDQRADADHERLPKSALKTRFNDRKTNRSERNGVDESDAEAVGKRRAAL